MRAIKVYCPPGVEPPLYAFIDALDGKLKAKLLWQIFRLRNLPACELKEPHFKHFSLERYSQMYELREKGKVLIRIVFTVQNEDIILLTSFIKRQPRDTLASWRQSKRPIAYIEKERGGARYEGSENEGASNFPTDVPDRCAEYLSYADAALVIF